MTLLTLILLVLQLVTGTRLLALAWSTRLFPELGLGSVLIFAAATNATGLILAAFFPDAVQLRLVAVQFLWLLTGASLYFSIWKIFRPENRLIFWAGIAVFVLSVCGLAWDAILPAAAGSVRSRSLYVLTHGFIALTTWWSAIETTVHHQKLRRKLRYGLASALSVHQFLLWSLSNWCSAAYYLITEGVTLLALDETPFYGWVTVLVTFRYVLLYFSFLPPKAYARFISR